MTCLMSALPPRLSLLLLESERSVLVHEKGKKKHMQTAPPLRARQSIMGNGFKEGTRQG